MSKIRCPKCNSIDVEFKCHHNNRRKKVPIDIYFCKQCKKRFNIIGDTKYYNHSGNFRTRKNLCWHCCEKLDSDAERLMGTCIDCLVKSYDDHGHYLTDDFQEYWEMGSDFDRFSKI